MSTKAALHAAIDGMDEEQAEDLLDYLNLLADPDTLTPEEEEEVRKGEEEIARGEFVTMDEVKRELGLDG